MSFLRIRRRPEFERVYNKGARIRGRFMTLFVLPNGGEVPRFGVAATRKLGSAVERNRAKRLSREVFRRHKVGSGLDIVIVPRREMLDAPFSNLEADYYAALERGNRVRPRSERDPDRRGDRGARAGVASSV
ncbi:MAG TPA: ribonuclease P protein component [Vicinamibacterales bacterium]